MRRGAAMKSLVDLVRDLCLFRRGPQDIPYSTSTLAALAALSLVVDLVYLARIESVAVSAVRVAIGLAAMLGLPWLALKLADKDARWVQTASALVATNVVFTVIALPLLLSIGAMPQKPEDVTGAQALLSLVLIFISGWQLAVRGHVLRHALNLPMRLGVLIAVVFVAIEVLVVMIVFGQGAEAA